VHDYIEIIEFVRHPKKKFLPAAHYRAWALGVRHASNMHNCKKNSVVKSQHFWQMNTAWQVL